MSFTIMQTEANDINVGFVILCSFKEWWRRKGKIRKEQSCFYGLKHYGKYVRKIKDNWEGSAGQETWLE